MAPATSNSLFVQPTFWLMVLLIAIVFGAVAFIWNKMRGAHMRRELELEKGKNANLAKLDLERAIKESELKAKIKYQEMLNQADNEHRNKRLELQKIEERLSQREETIEKKLTILDTKELDLSKREKGVKEQTAKCEKQEQDYKGLVEQANTRLETIAHYSKEQAKRELISSIEWESKQEAAKLVKKIEEEAKQNAEKSAKRIIGIAIQRYAGEHVAERSVSNVQLPNDAMKGRIIGREGRNIRALEQTTGVDIIIDDTPDVVILSAFNPIRREIAKVALERLIADGRIHPPRIEEMVETVKKELEKQMFELGKKASFDLGIHGIHPELLKLVGALNYRTSYTQNQYLHAQEVAYVAGMMATELKLDSKPAKRAGLLHDIGKAMDHEVEGSHALIGADFAKKHGEPEEVWHAIGAHHEDMPQESILDILIQAADCLSGARPGARREALENYIKRLEDLERISTSFPGVDKAFAIQAGREVRIIVSSEKINDHDAIMLSRDIARKIESEIVFPGEIKVTVIREIRAVEIAR